jgi:hypothetical protein
MGTYSRLQSLEEKKNIRKAALFIGLTIVTFALLIFVGIPLFGRLASFVSDLKNGGKAASKTDITPPAPPSFSYFSKFTNQENLAISGNTESGATVKLTFNGKDSDALANKDGAFTFDLILIDGLNTFTAVAIDESGNISQKTQGYQVSYDNKPPELSVSSPTDGASFFGSNQRQVTIQGETEPASQVVINDRIISVEDNGSFQYTTTLNEGSNQFIVKSNDQAGNLTEKTISLNFAP